MYTNFEIKNVKASDDIEIEGEVMLMRMHDYIPTAQSATAEIARRAGKFVCHFEVCSETDFFIVEAASADVKFCIKTVERKMLQKMGLTSATRNHFAALA